MDRLSAIKKELIKLRKSEGAHDLERVDGCTTIAEIAGVSDAADAERIGGILDLLNKLIDELHKRDQRILRAVFAIGATNNNLTTEARRNDLLNDPTFDIWGMATLKRHESRLIRLLSFRLNRQDCSANNERAERLLGYVRAAQERLLAGELKASHIVDAALRTIPFS